AIGEPESFRQRRAGTHVRFREIDEGDVTAVFRGERTRRTAQPATDVEDAHPRRELSKPREPIRRSLAAAVKLIGGSEIVYRQRVDSLAGSGKRLENRALEVGAPPVLIGGGGVATGHRARSCELQGDEELALLLFQRKALQSFLRVS